jgi:hypothetical protein
MGTNCAGGVLDLLVLDGSLSYGFQGFTRIYVWTYTYMNGTSASAPQPLDVAPFSAGFSPTGDTVTLQSSWLRPENSPYNFMLSVGREVPRRIEGAVYSVPAVLTVTRVERPVVKVLVVPPVQVRRARQTAFYAKTSLCTGDAADTSSEVDFNAVYSWKQTAGPPLDLSAIPLDRFNVRLPALTLDTFETYAFEVTVALQDSAIAPSSTTISFDVLPSPPTVLIDGPQYRLLPYDAPLLLDASTSFDPDYPQRGTSKLDFFWPFPDVSSATPVTAECQKQVDDFIFTWVTLEKDEPTLSLPALSNLLCPGLQYEFRVSVSHADLPIGFEGTAPTLAYAVVAGDAEPPTPVGATTVHTIRADVELLDANRFNLAAFPADVRLRLMTTVEHTITTYANVLSTGPGGDIVQVVESTETTVDTHTGTIVEDGYSLRYRWTETHDYFDARDVANLAAPIDRAALIVEANVMASLAGNATEVTKEPVTLRVDVELVAPDGFVADTAQSFVTVTLNAAPEPGYATIDATQGFAGATVFAATCLDFVDSDEPLSYSFAYVRAGVSPPVYYPLTTRATPLTADLVLPSGELRVVCFAFDSYGARSVASTPSPAITVAPSLGLVVKDANDTCTLAATTADVLEFEALEPLSLSSALQRIAGLLSSLPAGGCSHVDCSVYNAFVDAVAALTQAAIADDVLTDETVTQVSAVVADIARAPGLPACVDAFTGVTDVIVDLMQAINATDSADSAAGKPLEEATITLQGSTGAISQLDDALASLVESIDASTLGCEQFTTLSNLVSDVLAVGTKGAVAGETSQGVAGSELVASTTRISGVDSSATGDSSAASGGVSFNVTGEATGGRECTDFQIVEFSGVSPQSCRPTASPLVSVEGRDISLTLNATGAGLNEPASSIIRADLFDCDGNVIPVEDLNEPLSFLVPLSADALLAPSTITAACPAETSYLPNDGNVASQELVIEKQVECSYWDEETEAWSTDGCVVADANVTMDDGRRAVRCECTHLTDFAILLREKNSQDATECNLAPGGVFGSIVFVIFAGLYTLLLLFGARQTFHTVVCFGLKQKSMLVQHSLLCMICCLRIFVCVVYYMLQFESVRARLEFKAVAAVSGLPYILMYWLFALLVANWAAIYFAAKKNALQGVAEEFKKMRKLLIGSGSVVTLLFSSLFITIALSKDAKLRQNITLAGSAMLAAIAVVLSVVYVGFGYGLLVQLSKDFKSSSAERLCKVGIVFCCCFVGEAVIWLLSAIDPRTFFDNFEAVNSLFFTLDLIALICIVLVSFKSLKAATTDRSDRRRKMRRMASSGRMTLMSKSGMRGSAVGSIGESRTGKRGSTAGLAGSSANDSKGASWRGKRGSVVLKTKTGYEAEKGANGSRRKSGKYRTKLDKRAERFRRPLRRTFDLSTMDPDDDRYDARITASAKANLRRDTMETKVETDVGGKKKKVGNWRRFSRENEKGDLLIDMDAVANDDDQQVRKHKHWFENLPSYSDASTVSSLSFSEDDDDDDDDGSAKAKVKEKKKKKISSYKKSAEKTTRAAPNLSTGLSAEASSLISKLTGEATNAKAAASKMSSSDSSSISSLMSLSSSSSSSSSAASSVTSDVSDDLHGLVSLGVRVPTSKPRRKAAPRQQKEVVPATAGIAENSVLDNFSFSDSSSNNTSPSSFNISDLDSSSLSVSSNRPAEKISAKKISAKKKVAKSENSVDDFSFSDYSSNISGVSSLSSFDFSDADSGSSPGLVINKSDAAAVYQNARGSWVYRLHDVLQDLDLGSMSSNDEAAPGSQADSDNGAFSTDLQKYLARVGPE